MNFKLQISTYSVCSAHQLLPVIKVVVGTYCVDAMFFCILLWSSFENDLPSLFPPVPNFGIVCHNATNV